MYSFFYSRQIILQRVGIHRQHLSTQEIHILIGNGNAFQLLKSLDLSYALNDTLFIIDGLKEIAHTYINMNHEDSALICYKKAYELSQSINEEELSGCLLSQYAYLENSLGNKEVADSLIEKALMYDYKTENLKSVLYAITSKIYMQRGKSQQALPYLLWLCDNGSIYAKRNAYRNITLYHIQKMQWHDALKYNK